MALLGSPLPGEERGPSKLLLHTPALLWLVSTCRASMAATRSGLPRLQLGKRKEMRVDWMVNCLCSVCVKHYLNSQKNLGKLFRRLGSGVNRWGKVTRVSGLVTVNITPSTKQ